MFVCNPKNKTLFQLACEELLTTMKFLEKTGDSQFVMNRMLLIISSLNEYPADGYNNIGDDAQCLMQDSKLRFLEILRNEFIPN